MTTSSATTTVLGAIVEKVVVGDTIIGMAGDTILDGVPMVAEIIIGVMVIARMVIGKVEAVGDTVIGMLGTVRDMIIDVMFTIGITVEMVIVLVRDGGQNHMVPATSVDPGCGPVSGGPRRRWVVDPILTLLWKWKLVSHILGKAGGRGP